MEVLLLVIGLALGAAGMHFFRKADSSASLLKLEQLEEKAKVLEETQKKLETREELLQEKEKQITKLEAQGEQMSERLRGASKKIADFEAREESRDKKLEDQISKTEELRKALEEERMRVRDERTKEIETEKENKDRIWNEHEAECLVRMREICQKPDLDFVFHDNTNLPASFDGKFKPDFLVEFLGQYIVFDAKMNKPDTKHTLQEYLKVQAKRTAEKIKGSSNIDEIYNVVFFVVPSIAIGSLKQTSFYEQGIGFHAVSIEAFEPILSAFKKVTYYDNIDSLDPKERENIITTLATYDQHVRWQNALNILGSLGGLKVSQTKEQMLGADMLEELNLKRDRMRIENLKPTDLKRLIQHPEEQVEEMQKMVRPKKPEISEKDLEEAQGTLL